MNKSWNIDINNPKDYIRKYVIDIDGKIYDNFQLRQYCDKSLATYYALNSREIFCDGKVIYQQQDELGTCGNHFLFSAFIFEYLKVPEPYRISIGMNNLYIFLMKIDPYNNSSDEEVLMDRFQKFIDEYTKQNSNKEC